RIQVQFTHIFDQLALDVLQQAPALLVVLFDVGCIDQLVKCRVLASRPILFTLVRAVEGVIGIVARTPVIDAEIIVFQLDRRVDPEPETCPRPCVILSTNCLRLRPYRSACNTSGFLNASRRWFTFKRRIPNEGPDQVLIDDSVFSWLKFSIREIPRKFSCPARI